MNLKKVLVLFIVLVAVGAFYFWDQRRLEEKAVEQEKAKELFTWQMGDVASVTLNTPSETISVKKTAGGWEMVSPVSAAADQDAIQLLLETLQSAKLENVATESVENLGQFGLDPPIFMVTLEDSEGKPSGALKVGDEVVTRNYHFACISDSSRVFTVPSSVKTAIDKQPSDLRDKVVFHVIQDKIQKLDVRYPEGHGIIASGTEAEKWRIREPIDVVADWSDINSFMGRVSRLRVKEFIEEAPSDLSPYGLIQDVTRLAVFEADRAEPLVLLIGDYNAAQSAYYAKHENKPNVFTVEAPFVRALPKDAFDWRPEKPLPVWDYQANLVQVQQSDGAVILELGKDSSHNWEMKQPALTDQAELDTNKIREFVNAFQEYTVVRYATETLDTTVTGLDSPSYTITVSGEIGGATKTYQLMLGNEIPEEGLVYGKRASDDEIFMGSNSILAHVSQSHEELLKRSFTPQALEDDDLDEEDFQLDFESVENEGSLEIMPGVQLKSAEPE